MAPIFSNVVADLDKDFKGKFPAHFDYAAMVKKVSDDAGVKVKTTESGDSLQGLWVAMEQVHSLLSTALAVYGAPAQDPQVNYTNVDSVHTHIESQYLIAKYLKKSNEIPSDCIHAVNSVLETRTDNVCRDDAVQMSSRTVWNTPIKNLLVNVTKNIEPASIFAAHVDDLLSSAIELESDNKMTFDDGSGLKLDSPTNSATCIPMKKKSGRPRKQVRNKEVKNMPNFQLKFRKKYSHRKRPLHSDGSKLRRPRGRGRPCKFPEGEPDQHFCRECNFVAKTRSSLSDHCHRMHLARPTKCDVCHKIFPNHRYMKRHRASHIEPQHCCDICGKMYKIRKAMLEHKKTHEEGYARPSFACEMCSKTFCNHYVLTCHVKSEHLGQKRNFLCSVCGKSFTTKHSLQEHSNAHTGAKPHMCEICGKGFSYESALRDHKFVHVDDKQFVCGVCGKAFSQRSGLKMHTRIHEQVKQFVCSDCGREFTQKQALQRHERVHKGVKPFICKLCSRSFSDASIIRRHLILVHKIHKDAKAWREDIVCKVQGAANYRVERIPSNEGMQEHGSQINMEGVRSDTKEDEQPGLSPATFVDSRSTSTSVVGANESRPLECSDGQPLAHGDTTNLVQPPLQSLSWYSESTQHENHDTPQKPEFSRSPANSVCTAGNQSTSSVGHGEAEVARRRELVPHGEHVKCTESSFERKATEERLYVNRQVTDCHSVRNPLSGSPCDSEHSLPFPVDQRSSTETLIETDERRQSLPSFHSHVTSETNPELYSQELEEVSHHGERSSQYMLEAPDTVEGPHQYASTAVAQSEASVCASSNTLPTSSQAWPMYAYYSHLASQFGMTLGEYPYTASSSSSHQ